MKAIRCLIAGIICSAFACDADAADHQKGIKMLINAASGHHHFPASVSNVDPDDKQRGIETLIEAATASRHPRPLSSPYAAKGSGRGDRDRDVSSKGDVEEYMDRTLRDLRSGAIAARESAIPKAEPGPGPAATPDAAIGGASVSGDNAGAATPGARTRAVAVGLWNARRNRIASQDFSAVTGVPSLPSRGTLNGTCMGRPPPAIGGAAITTNAGRLNGTAFRTKH